MGKTIILGIGNQLMMDDGAGIYLVEELASKNENVKVEYLIGESDVDYCLERIQGSGMVIVVDAVFSGKQVGDVSVIPLRELREQKSLDISPHNIHLFHVLHQQKQTEGYLLAVEPSSIQFHIGLSDELEAQWEDIRRAAEGKIEQLITNHQEW